jgi:L-histidine N-alpha-methyltransferase
MPTATRDTFSEAVLHEALTGLTASPKTLSPWLFYDECGSQLFEQITALPEYYLTRTERAILVEHADEILETASQGARLTLLELGAGTATKTGLLLKASADRQGSVLYQPIDVSASALDEAAASIAAHIPGVAVESQVANYTSEPFTLSRLPGERALALYIGSSIGNFSPADATKILQNLRDHLAPGDSLLLGTDLAPGARKSIEFLEAAYDDAEGVTAAFNLNVLARLNRDIGADFRLDQFAHRALWNAADSRIEMHLESLTPQTVNIGGERIAFTSGETIHTENSYKFHTASIAALLKASGFTRTHTWHDPDKRFAVTLAEAT